MARSLSSRGCQVGIAGSSPLYWDLMARFYWHLGYLVSRSRPVAKPMVWASREPVMERFDWDIIVNRLLALLASVSESAAGRRVPMLVLQ